MITKTELKTFLGITLNNYDSVIDQIILGVEKYIESYCNNIIDETSVTDYVSAESIIDNDNAIYLSNRLNLAELKVYKNTGTEKTPVWDEIDRDDYNLYSTQGKIVLKSVTDSSLGEFGYKVSYKAGFKVADVPDDIKLACMKLASAILNKRKAEGLSAESLEGQSVTFANSMSDEIKGLLNKYKSFLI